MKRRDRAAGLSYIEALVGVLLLALAITPALDALDASLRADGARAQAERWRSQLADCLEQRINLLPYWLADAASDAGGPGVASWLSDPADAEHRCLVYVAHYDPLDLDGDGDPFSADPSDPLWVRVTVDGQPLSLATLVYP